MSSISNDIGRILAAAIRVSRGHITADDLISVWPSLQQKALQDPQTLTETERRLFFDLPDEDAEAANIHAATKLSRQQLIEKACSSAEDLTTEEVALLAARFWTARTTNEMSSLLKALADTSKEGIEEFYAARRLCAEQAAFDIGMRERRVRAQARTAKAEEIAAQAALPYAKPWIQQLYRSQKPYWGFVCLYDASIQQLTEEKIWGLENALEQFFRMALENNGLRDIINYKWALAPFNGPSNAHIPGRQDQTYQDGGKYRQVFRDIMGEPATGETESVSKLRSNFYMLDFKDGIATSGILTNTFLVLDTECMNSIITGEYFPSYDDMRILAFEADYPVPGRTYVEGYQGYTWVRLDQLVFNFYELRATREKEIGMDDIWKAGQVSSHQAFVSLDVEEAIKWTRSNYMRGFDHDSVLGKSQQAIRAARRLKATQSA